MKNYRSVNLPIEFCIVLHVVVVVAGNNNNKLIYCTLYWIRSRLQKFIVTVCVSFSYSC